MTAPNATALSAYRTLLRAARVAFQGTLFPSSSYLLQNLSLTDLSSAGDARLLSASFTQARQSFEAQRSSPPDKIREGVQHAFEVARVLREQVVQGAKVEGQNAIGTEERYQLRIHDETERGTNESVKTGSLDVGAMKGGGCCGGNNIRP